MVREWRFLRREESRKSPRKIGESPKPWKPAPVFDENRFARTETLTQCPVCGSLNFRLWRTGRASQPAGG